MSLARQLIALFAVMLCVTPVSADTVAKTNGSDRFVAGDTVIDRDPGQGDTFVAGRSVSARGISAGDLHVCGFDVEVEADTQEDLYAVGSGVSLRGTVGEDVSAFGFTVRTAPSSKVAGNARLFGDTVTIEGPVSGALSAVGRSVVLNAPIEGDVWIVARQLSFGPDAKIGGTLVYSSKDQIAIPERVITKERVTFEKLSESKIWDEMNEDREFGEYLALPTFMSVFSAFLITLIFFIILGAIFLTFSPKTVETMRKGIAARPGNSVLLGVVGLSMLFGMVPITAMTVVGLPFVPIVVLLIMVTWTLGYVLGAYAVAVRIWGAFGGPETPSKPARLLALAVAVTCVTILNFIPLVGWVINFTLVLLGVGAITIQIFEWLIGNPGYALDVDMKPIEKD